jgi:hypothetical protein
MATASLTFSLPDESYEHLCAVHGRAFHIKLHNIDERLRTLVKHADGEKICAIKLAQEIRAEIADALAVLGEV